MKDGFAQRKDVPKCCVKFSKERTTLLDKLNEHKHDCLEQKIIKQTKAEQQIKEKSCESYNILSII